MDTPSKRQKLINFRLILLFLVFWTPLIVFFKLAGEIIEEEPIESDIAVLNWLHGHASPLLDQVLLAFTNIGGVIGMTIIMTVLVASLVYKRQFRNATLLFAGVGGTTAANIILKGLFHRSRPSLFSTQVVETSFSFPSGHAMASAAFTLCLVLMTWNTKWRWPVVLLGALYTLAVGISRPYFGVHYPSDILAGWCASVAWVVLVFYVINRFGNRSGQKEAER